MKTVLFILLLIKASKAAYNITCSNSPTTETLTFKPSEDPHLVGRYKVEFCQEAHSNVTNWSLVLRGNTTYTSKECNSSENRRRRFGTSHSIDFIPVQNDLNCTQVCFSTFLDRVLTNTCYKIETYLIFTNPIISHQSESSTPVEGFYYITNNVTKENITQSGHSQYYA